MFMFVVGRAVSGMGSGILAIVVPMYQGEVATAETRGAMMCVVRSAHHCLVDQAFYAACPILFDTSRDTC